MKGHRTITFIALISAAALGCNALTGATRTPTPAATATALPVEAPGPGTAAPQAADVQVNVKGDPNAAVTLMEFADYQCPYCRMFWEETEAQVVEQYVTTGKVRFVARSAGNFISDAMGAGKTESQDAAMAALCAGDQGKFWEMREALYRGQRGEDIGTFSTSRLEALARSLSLDTAGFSACLIGNQHLEDVQQDFQDAKSAGIQGVPFFVISYLSGNQTLFDRIDGAQPFSVFQQKLDAALAAAGVP